MQTQTLMPASPPQTLYVQVRRDELQRLKQERDDLQAQVAYLNSLLQRAQPHNAAAAR